jgi:hypothetical protein
MGAADGGAGGQGRYGGHQAGRSVGIAPVSIGGAMGATGAASSLPLLSGEGASHALSSLNVSHNIAGVGAGQPTQAEWSVVRSNHLVAS